MWGVLLCEGRHLAMALLSITGAAWLFQSGAGGAGLKGSPAASCGSLLDSSGPWYIPVGLGGAWLSHLAALWSPSHPCSCMLG